MSIWVYLTVGIIVANLLLLLDLYARLSWVVIFYILPKMIIGSSKKVNKVMKIIILSCLILLYPLVPVFLFLISPIVAIVIIYLALKNKNKSKEYFYRNNIEELIDEILELFDNEYGDSMWSMNNNEVGFVNFICYDCGYNSITNFAPNTNEIMSGKDSVCIFPRLLMSFIKLGQEKQQKSNEIYYLGYQCQSCGKFHVVSSEKGMKTQTCSCGVKLKRNRGMFCPQCKSKNLSIRPHRI